MNELGLDISRHQGTVIDWDKVASSGVKFLYIKCSQGTDHKDPNFEANIVNAKKVGIKVGPYHFTTTGNALDQYNWFVYCMGGTEFDLVPALDCEYYSGYGDNLRPILQFRYNNPPLSIRISGAINTYSITTQEIVDSIGRRLTNWITTKPKLKDFIFPTIYTNVSSGNRIFTKTIMNRYPLWVAHWHGPSVRLTKPTLPRIWKDKDWYIWQDEVVDGDKYGFPSKVDHDIWGKLFEFPGEEKDYFNVIGKTSNNLNVAGRIEIL